MSFWLFLFPHLLLAWGTGYGEQPFSFSHFSDNTSGHLPSHAAAPGPEARVEVSGWFTRDGLVPQPGLTRFTHASFGSERLDEHLGWYSHQVALHGPPDILIVGSSRALQGVDPIALRQALGDRGFGQLSVYNFGINGATVQVIDLLLREILNREQLPRLVLWADGVRAFNSGRRDRTYESIIDSQGYRLLRTGIRPQVPRFPPSSQQCYDAPLSSTDISLISETLSTPCLLPPISQRLQASLWDKAIASLQAYRPLEQLTPLGFLPVSDIFDPQTYYTQHPRIAGQFDGDYTRFSLQGEQAIALSQLLPYLQQRQIPLVYVNLPLTQDYLDPVRLAREREFHQMLHWYQYNWRLNVVNLVATELAYLADPRYFADPSHINQYGAIAVARQLAKMENVPWPRGDR